MAVVAEKLSEQVQTILSKKIEENSLVLPAPPTVVTRVLQLVGDASFSPKDATPLVERDSVIAARVLRAANSVDQAGVDRVRTLPEALTRLGVDALRSLLIEISAHRLFESRDARIGAHTRGLWEHSIAVAVLARELAGLSGVAEPEAAYLAGLLHDIGKPVVAFLLLEAEKNVVSTRSSWIDSDAWVEVLQKVHRPIGVALAQKWGLPEPVASAIRDCTEYQTSERASAGNCVRLANALAKRCGLYVGSIDRTEVESQIAVGNTLLGVDDAAVNGLCEGLEARVRALVV
ncbi:MAG: HDOD domain-containing protein [Myxococcales bacterium]|nr:HDOD domain-containing protein [Myxococcales bacterium]